MDVSTTIEDIFNRSMTSFHEFEEAMNARFNQSLSAISGSTISDNSASTEFIPMSQQIMPLPNNYEGMNMDEFMDEWMNNEQEMLGQTIINHSQSKQHNSTGQSITMVYHNTSGMKSKIHELNDYLHLTKFDMLLFAETWFDESVDSINIIAGITYTLHGRDQSSYGGGVVKFQKWLLKIV